MFYEIKNEQKYIFSMNFCVIIKLILFRKNMENNTLNKPTNIKAINHQQIKQWILDIVAKKSLDRSALILECIKNFNLTKDELKNKSSDSVLTQAKSRTGFVLSQLINNGDLFVEEKKIKLNRKSVQEIIKKDEIEQEIVKILSDKKSYTSKQIYNLVIKQMRPNNQSNIRSLSGIALTNLTNARKILKNGDLYTISKDDEFPNTDMGICLKEAQKSNDLFPFFIKAFNIMGGEFFEEFTVKLIAKYLSKNGTISSSNVTGGPNDDGIDGIISYTDNLNFKETIFIQAKVRSNSYITLKETREFLGALYANKGTRGIFITNGSFHHQTLKFIEKQNNLIGIDGKKLFQLAKDVQYGVTTKENKDLLDCDLFIS